MKRQKDIIDIGPACVRIFVEVVEGMGAIDPADVKGMESAFQKALDSGRKAHPHIRKAAGSLIEDADVGARDLITACLGATIRPLPEWLSWVDLSAFAECSLLAQTVRKLKTLHRLETAVWRGDEQSIRGLYQLWHEYQRVHPVVRDIERAGSDAALFYQRALETVAVEGFFA